MNKSKKNQIKAVILDLDGTLVDLKIDWTLVRNKMADFCSKNSITADFSYPNPIYEVARASLRGCEGKSFYNNLIAIIKREELRSAGKSKLIPGVKDFLKFLHINKIPFAILSNNNSQCIIKIFKKFKLPNPKVIVGSDNIKELKPHPEGLNKIFKKMKIKNTQCLLIGDSVAELRLGKIASVETFISDAYYKIKKIRCSFPSDQVRNFRQLKEILL